MEPESSSSAPSAAGAEGTAESPNPGSVAAFRQSLVQAGATPLEAPVSPAQKAQALGLTLDGPQQDAFLLDDGSVVDSSGVLIARPAVGYQVPKGMHAPEPDAFSWAGAEGSGGISTNRICLPGEEPPGCEPPPPPCYPNCDPPPPPPDDDPTFSGSVSITIDDDIHTGEAMTYAESQASEPVDEIYTEAKTIATVNGVSDSYYTSSPEYDTDLGDATNFVNTVAGDVDWEGVGTHEFTYGNNQTESLPNSSVPGSSNLQVSSCNPFQRSPSDGTVFGPDDDIEVKWRPPCLDRQLQIRLVRVIPGAPNKRTRWISGNRTGLLNDFWYLRSVDYDFGFDEVYDFPFLPGDYKWQVRVAGESGYNEGTFTVEGPETGVCQDPIVSASRSGSDEVKVTFDSGCINQSVGNDVRFFAKDLGTAGYFSDLIHFVASEPSGDGDRYVNRTFTEPDPISLHSIRDIYLYDVSGNQIDKERYKQGPIACKLCQS